VLHGRGAELYDVAAQQQAQRALVGAHQFPSGLLAFLHPPHAALAGVPLGLLTAWLGEPAAFRLWAAVNVALLVSLARTLGRLVAPSSLAERLLVAAAVAGAFPVFLTVREGQVALLLVVALLRLGLALEDGRDLAAAVWLLVLSIKPQLIPLPLAALVAFRRWRALGFAAALATAAALASVAVLGPGIFARYLRGLGALQEHLGRGAPDAMLDLRGLLVRLLGADRARLATAVSFAACGAAALAFWLAWVSEGAAEGGGRGRGWVRPEVPGGGDPPEGPRRRLAYASACAAALFFSPHLFVGDLTLWAAPLGLGAAALGNTSPAARSFRRFALAWPVAIAATLAIDAWPRLFFETATGLSLAATVWLAWLSFAARPAAARARQPS
jgi:hypothetical protein